MHKALKIRSTEVFALTGGDGSLNEGDTSHALQGGSFAMHETRGGKEGQTVYFNK